jgi:hypothetical protein
VFLSCEGDEGPIGPAGPPGAGTRTVITSEAQSIDGQFVSIPELDLSDFPLVDVYVSDDIGYWAQLNLIISDYSSSEFIYFKLAILSDGGVTIYSDWLGNPFKIVFVY